MAGIWYRAGTASVTNGSKKVTGFGSQWKTTTYKPDKGHTFWGPDGKAYEIDYVESDTVLYLVMAYAGVTAASQAYSIDITRTSTIPAFSRELSAQLAFAQAQYDSWQQVLTGSGMVTLTAPDGQQVQVPALSAFQPTSASLKALQALTPAKDKLPVFNGPAGAELITLTAYMRTLLDDADAVAARGTLGLSNVDNTSDLSKPVSDATKTALNSKQDSGTINFGGSTANTNWNSWGQFGILSGEKNELSSRQFDDGNGAGLNSPINAQLVNSYGVALNISSGGFAAQLAIGEVRGTAVRVSYNGVPTYSWRYLYDTHNILGVVSQSGGVPTGSIIERGANANGEYIKYADGLMICISADLEIPATPISSGFSALRPHPAFMPYIITTLAVPVRTDSGSIEALGALFRNGFHTGGSDSSDAVITGYTYNSALTTKVFMRTISYGRWY